MTIHEFGIEHLDIVVLFHPNCVWWEVFNLIIPILSHKYHLIVPAMPGHDTELPNTDYTSVEEIAEDMENWLIEHGHSRVRCLYGCSMGGSVVTRMIADSRIKYERIVIDAGMTPYQLPQLVTYFIAIRDWCMLEIGKHCSTKFFRGIFAPEKYSSEDLQYIKKVLKSLSSKTIWRSFYSCNNYSMPNPVPLPDCPVEYWYGDEEKDERKSDIAYIKRIFPNVKLVENSGMGHAEYFTLHPREFCTQLIQFIESQSI